MTEKVITGHGRPIHVRLYEGLVRDKVVAWQDVRPAAGGSLGSRSCWHRGDRGQRLFDLVCANIETTLVGGKPTPIPKPFK